MIYSKDRERGIVKAVVLRGFGQPLVVEDRPDPVGPDVIDVTACGVCHSDLHVVDGTYPSPTPLVLGHEITGFHAELGPVMVYAPWGCRQPSCAMCASGQEMICPNAKEVGLFQDGGYCERFAVSDRRYLHALDGLDPVISAPLACGGLTAYRAVQHGVELLQGKANARALVIGAGGLGQFAIQYLRILTDAEVHVIDASAAKHATAVVLGAHAASETADGLFDVVLDFVGAQATLETAVRSVARQGLVVVVGLFGGQVPFGLGLVPHEARLMSSIWGTNAQLGELLQLARRETLRYNVEAMPLDAAQQAHDRLRAGSVIGRVVLTPSRG
jgi:alcohol dehydrogenase, propanol-preferring